MAAATVPWVLCAGHFMFIVSLSFLKAFNNFLFIYLFLAALGLCCCARGFSLAVASRGYFSFWCSSFLLRWLLLFQSMGSRAQASIAVVHRLSCSGPVESCWSWDPSRVPCTSMQILNHWATREVPSHCLFIYQPPPPPDYPTGRL